MKINFFRISTRSPSDRLNIIEKNKGSKVTNDYMFFGKDYFDNPNHSLGYHGYNYDGRFSDSVAEMIKHYNLSKNMKILELGCAKGFVLIEFFKQGMAIMGIDQSLYAVENSHPDIRNYISQGSANKIPFEDGYFDLVLSKEMLPHIFPDKLEDTLKECKRVSKGKIFFEIQCGRTNTELENMKQWDRTHRIINPPEWWESLFKKLDIPCDVQYNILVPDLEKNS